MHQPTQISLLQVPNLSLTLPLTYLPPPPPPTSATFHITVESWRDPRLQPFATVANMIHDFILLPTYTQYVTTPVMFTDVQMMEVHTSSSTAIKKLWQFVNLAFNW